MDAWTAENPKKKGKLTRDGLKRKKPPDSGRGAVSGQREVLFAARKEWYNEWDAERYGLKSSGKLAGTVQTGYAEFCGVSGKETGAV